MIEPADLLELAVQLSILSVDLVAAAESEAAARRSISSCYYALFHTVASAGAELFTGAEAQRQRIARSFEHGAVATAAGRLDASHRRKHGLQPVDDRLSTFGRTLAELRRLRERADYDLSATFTSDDAVENCSATRVALTAFDAVRSEPDTVDFLLEPLLRGRRG